MVIQVVHDRIVVGLRIEEWNQVYYEPISAPEDLTTPDLAPDVGLYSHSRGGATETEPMFGEVAWEPLLNYQYFSSTSVVERRRLQSKILYDAWRYLVAKNPRQIAAIKEQLQGSHRQRRLLKELDKARKARTNGLKQREKRKAKGLRSKNPDQPARSIEKPNDADDDSGLGSDTDDTDDDDDDGDDSDDDGNGNDNDEDGWQMPPPSGTKPRVRPGLRFQPVAESPISESEIVMSGVRGDSIDAESSAAISSAPRSLFAAASGNKRKSQPSPGSQRNVRPREEGKGLFATPPASTMRPRSTFSVLSGQQFNGGLSFDEALATAERQSLAPDDRRSIHDANGGLDPDEAWRRAMRESQGPEGGIENDAGTDWWKSTT